MPVFDEKRLEVPLDRGHQAVVVQRGRAQLARELQQLVHGLVHERLELHHLRREPRRRVLGERLESQQDRGERLVHLVVQIAGHALALVLLRADHHAAAAPPLRLDAAEQTPERVGEPVDLHHGALLLRAEAAGLSRVDRLEPLIRLSSGEK